MTSIDIARGERARKKTKAGERAHKRVRHWSRKGELLQGDEVTRRIIRWVEVLRILPLKETMIRTEYIDTGRLRPVPLGERAVGFVAEEVYAIVEELIAARDAETVSAA